MNPLVEYFRCPEHLAVLATGSGLSADAGYFRFGDAICYGRQAVGGLASRPDGRLVDVARGVSSSNGHVVLPFDLSEVLTNLLYERYARATPTLLGRVSASGIAHSVYYMMRPALPVAVRKHLQRLRLSRWRHITFPRWPVDSTIETLMKECVGLAMTRAGVNEVPFIWFWPGGAPGCVMMTHDVEGQTGAAFAPRLMDLDGQFDIRSSFQIVPEARYSRRLLEQCRRRGFEVNAHDFNHDGHLFHDRALFERRAIEINRHAREFGSRGFRAALMNRRQDWFSALDVAFDMSVPNVAHLEPQQGGCCTVMPYFIGNLLELPLTTTQDYSLFHILRDYSIGLWRQQIEMILPNHGLVSFITHPDYLTGKRERDVYVELLTHLARLREERQVWIAPPSEIDRWWRHRHEMKLVPDGDWWRIEGPESAQARVACARVERGHVVYEVSQLGRAA
jgi:hypothetical protein